MAKTAPLDVQTALRSRYVVTAGYRTHYTEAGVDGPVIVALHGGGAGSSGAAGMAALIPFLADTYRIIAIDGVGGFGLTDTSAAAKYGLQSRVEQVEAVVDALGLDRFIIMGNSQGAWVAAKYAIQHPDRVDRMVLIASGSITSAMGIGEIRTPAAETLHGYDYTREGMIRLLRAIVSDESRVTEQLIDARFASSMRPGAREAMEIYTAGIKYLRSDVMKANFDMRESLPALTKHVPTIFFWGENDNFAPASQGRKLEPLLPDVPFHFVADAGHQVQTDQPELVADVMRTFLQG